MMIEEGLELQKRGKNSAMEKKIGLSIIDYHLL